MTSSLSRALFLLLAVVAVAAPPAHAQPGPKERLDSTPQGWYWLRGVAANEIVALLNDDTDARLIDLEIQTTEPLTFAAAFVRNVGVQRVNGWWWYYNATFQEIVGFVDENDARLIDIERYDDGLYAAVMVSNTGEDEKAWWYYAGVSAADMGSFTEQNEARLVDIESYDIDGTTFYDGIMIANSGEDQSGWYWWLNVDESFVSAEIERTGYRIIDLDVVSASTTADTRFNVIMVPPQSKWWWYYGITPTQITSLVNQNGARIVDIESYSTRAGRRYAVALTNNSTELTTSLANQLGYGSDGSTGFLLRQINGPTLAELQPDFQFEPASTVKIFHHFKAWREIKKGNDQTNSLLVYSENMNGSCPIGGGPNVGRGLAETTRLMMWNSDNPATEAIRARYGEASIMSEVRVFGGVSTQSDLNHAPLGCGGPAAANPNQLTLRDAGNLYQQISTTSVLDGVLTGFLENMQSHLTPEGNQWWLTNDVQQMIVDEANALGVPDIADSYWEAMEIAWKPGGYTLNGKNFVSVAGSIQIPTCNSGGYVERDYVFGLFIHDSIDTQRLFDVTQEMFRGEIRDGLEACRTVVDAPAVTMARALTLQNAVPNPFNPSTQIRFALGESGRARVSVVDTRGRTVATLVNGFREAGDHTVVWNGRDDGGAAVSSGIYFVKADAAGETQTRKITLLK